MKISIDPVACTGHGRCYALAPDLFEDDEQGYGQVLGDGDVSPDAATAARAAISSCPEQAVHLDP
jgi:ferredoxin